MIHISRFEHINGLPVESQVEEWADGYFDTLLNLFNGFFAKIDVAEAVARMELIPFDQLTAEELEGEKPEVIDMAVKRVKELFETELAFMRSYCEL